MTAGAARVLAIYIAIVGGLLMLSEARTGGRLIYPLDDTYVHMAIAKHVVADGVWGVTSEHFTSASSSPLWTAMLAATFAIGGVNDYFPLVLNLAIGGALLASVWRIFAGSMSPTSATVGTLAVMLAGTVPTMTALGMEHTLHALVTIWFVLLSSRLVAGTHGSRDLAAALGLAAILTLTRYEGAFAVVAVVLVLGFTRQWQTAIGVAVAGALPLLLFGLWSQSQGGFLLPNSVLLKGVTPVLTASGVAKLVLFWQAFTSLGASPHLVVLLVAVLALALVKSNDDRAGERRIAAIIFAVCLLLHLQFARVGWFFRYEAYLVIVGLVLVGVLVSGVDWSLMTSANRPRPLVATIAVLLVVITAFPLIRRGANAIRQVPGASSNIFEQQYQMALFLEEFYRGRRIAVNDVGAVGYFADVKLLDLYGLASADTAALKRRGEFSSIAVDRIATRDAVEIAVIYPTWLSEYGGVPPSWQKVGEWRVTDNLVLGESGVSFYAVKEGTRDTLVQNLAAYANRLPSTIVQEGAYRAVR